MFDDVDRTRPPELFVPFAQSPGKPIACLSELTDGLRRRSPAGAEVSELQQNARRRTGFPFVKNFVRRDCDVE
jgi:hypothetical protein